MNNHAILWVSRKSFIPLRSQQHRNDVVRPRQAFLQLGLMISWQVNGHTIPWLLIFRRLLQTLAISRVNDHQVHTVHRRCRSHARRVAIRPHVVTGPLLTIQNCLNLLSSKWAVQLVCSNVIIELMCSTVLALACQPTVALLPQRLLSVIVTRGRVPRPSSPRMVKTTGGGKN